MRSTRRVLVAVLWFLLAAQTASAAVGNPKLAHYLAANPLGGSPVDRGELETLVTAEQRALSALDPNVVVAAQGWSNDKTHTRLVEVAMAMSRNVAKPAVNARETVTSACGAAGGGATSFQAVKGIPNAYETECRSLVKPSAHPLEIVAFVKRNVFVLFFGSTAPAFSRQALEGVVRRQYGLIPGIGIPNTALA